MKNSVFLVVCWIVSLSPACVCFSPGLFFEPEAIGNSSRSLDSLWITDVTTQQTICFISDSLRSSVSQSRKPTLQWANSYSKAANSRKQSHFWEPHSNSTIMKLPMYYGALWRQCLHEPTNGVWWARRIQSLRFIFDTFSFLRKLPFPQLFTTRFGKHFPPLPYMLHAPTIPSSSHYTVSSKSLLFPDSYAKYSPHHSLLRPPRVIYVLPLCVTKFHSGIKLHTELQFYTFLESRQKHKILKWMVAGILQLNMFLISQ